MFITMIMVLLLLGLLITGFRLTWGIVKFIFGIGLFIICPLLIMLGIIFELILPLLIPIAIVAILYRSGFARG